MSRDCGNTLILRQRRQRLTSDEQLALSAHLQSCESCRRLGTFFEDLERAGHAQSGDVRRIARMTSLAHDWVAEHSEELGALDARRVAQMSRLAHDWARTRSGLLQRVKSELGMLLARVRKWPRWALAGAGVILLTGLASAAGWYARGVTSGADRGAEQALPAPAAIGKGSEEKPSVPAPDPTQAADTAASAEASPAKPSPSLRRAHAGHRASPATRAVGSEAVKPEPADETASSLFHDANALRRANQARRAIAVYQRLQELFPGSAEAQLSELSLGRLFLAKRPAAALRHFQGALSARAASSVHVEALYGKGLALKSLGRLKEERQVWEQLLREFPSCPYVVHAKRRLAE